MRDLRLDRKPGDACWAGGGTTLHVLQNRTHTMCGTGGLGYLPLISVREQKRPQSRRRLCVKCRTKATKTKTKINYGEPA